MNIKLKSIWISAQSYLTSELGRSRNTEWEAETCMVSLIYLKFIKIFLNQKNDFFLTFINPCGLSFYIRSNTNDEWWWRMKKKIYVRNNQSKNLFSFIPKKKHFFLLSLTRFLININIEMLFCWTPKKISILKSSKKYIYFVIINFYVWWSWWWWWGGKKMYNRLYNSFKKIPHEFDWTQEINNFFYSSTIHFDCEEIQKYRQHSDSSSCRLSSREHFTPHSTHKK